MKGIFFSLKKHFAILVLLVFAMSCSPYFTTHVIKVATLLPPVKPVSLNTNDKIAIVASIYPDRRGSDDIKIGIPEDSTVMVETSFFMKEALEKSPIFKGADFPVYQLKRDVADKIRQLQPNEIADVIEEGSETTRILSVEYIEASVASKTVYIEDGYGYSKQVLGVVPIEYIFRLYDLQGKMLDQTIIKDTLIFNSEISNSSELVFNACEHIAESYILDIVPSIDNGERYLLSGKNEELAKAKNLASEDNWKDAMEIWQVLAESKDQNDAAISSYNMAVACEVMGNFNLAKDWLMLAGKRDSSLKMPNYQALLETKAGLKTQMDKIKKENNL